MRINDRRSRTRNRARATGLALALLVVLSLGAGPPQVVRVRVPPEKVADAFPKGEPLRVLPVEEFEALLRSAHEAFAARSRLDGPRLIRARHEARWEDGMLRGRSELLIESPRERSSPLELVPWTPAIDAMPAESVTLRASDDGRAALWLEPGGRKTVTLAWQLRARIGSEGRVFALGLPRLDAVSLILDLPNDLVPEGPPGIRQGPGPGSAPGRQSWRFDGPGGVVDLRLRSKTSGGEASPIPRVWIGGPTEITIEKALATWRADWTVDPGEGGSRRLRVELDPSLEVIEVTGPGVTGFSVDASGATARLSVRLSDEIDGPTPITIRAVAPVPDVGTWNVPAARPLDATWTGGRTTVRIGPARVLENCQARAGLRVTPAPDRGRGGERRAERSARHRLRSADAALGRGADVPRAAPGCHGRGPGPVVARARVPPAPGVAHLVDPEGSVTHARGGPAALLGSRPGSDRWD